MGVGTRAVRVDLKCMMILVNIVGMDVIRDDYAKIQEMQPERPVEVAKINKQGYLRSRVSFIQRKVQDQSRKTHVVVFFAAASCGAAFLGAAAGALVFVTRPDLVLRTTSRTISSCDDRQAERYVESGSTLAEHQDSDVQAKYRRDRSDGEGVEVAMHLLLFVGVEFIQVVTTVLVVALDVGTKRASNLG
jgi:hypothetical protein